MAFQDQGQTNRNIWRPYLDSDDREMKQRSVDNHEVSTEKTMLRSYYESEGGGDRNVWKQQIVDNFETERRYLDFDWINNVTCNRGTTYDFTGNVPHAIGVPMWQEQCRQMWLEKVCIKAYAESSRQNDGNLTQKRSVYNPDMATADNFTKSANTATGVQVIESGRRMKPSDQRSQMSMDKSVLKAYYDSDRGNDSCVRNIHRVENHNRERSRLIVESSNKIHKDTDTTNIENGPHSMTDGQMVPKDTNGETFTRSGVQMQKRVSKYKLELLQCKYCNKSIVGKYNLRKHIRTIHEYPSYRPYSCNKCNATFKCDNSLRNHVRLHEGTPRFKYFCSDCKAGFNNTHTCRDSYRFIQCTYCNKNISRNNFRRHVRILHEDPYTRPYHCSKCDDTFKYKGSLKNHMAWHERTPSFKYSCSECKTGFNNKSALRLHMSIDNSNSDIKCDFCNFTFKYKGCYELHQKEHVVEDSHVNTQLFSEDSFREEIATNVNGTIFQDGEEEGDNITENFELSNSASTKTGTHLHESKKDFLKDTQDELIRNTVGTSEKITKSDQEVKIDLGFDLAGEACSLDSKNAMEPETDSEIMNENILRNPFINSNDSESKTACEEQQQDTVKDVIDEMSIGTDENYKGKFISSKRDGETCIVNEHRERDSESNDEDGALVIENIDTVEGGNTSIFLLGDSLINVGDSSEEDSRKSSICGDNCTKRGAEEELDGDKDFGVFDHVNISNNGPSQGDGGHPNEEKGSRIKNIRSKGKTKTNLKSTPKADRKIFKCDICKKTLSSKSSLNRHQVVHTGQKDYSCNVCGKAFALKATLKDHLRRHNGERPYKCGQCGKTFSSASLLSCHRPTHSYLRPYKCEICSRTFKYKSDFRTHNKYAHATIKAFRCHVCEATFKWRNGYKYHLKIHSGDNEFQCHHCNKVYCSKYSLGKHIKSVHEKTLVKPYHCGECGASFRNRYRLKRHMTTHDKQPTLKPKPTLKYSCAHCNAAFKTSKLLHLHMNMHKTNVFYKCDVCNIAFKLYNAFIKHQKKHAA